MVFVRLLSVERRRVFLFLLFGWKWLGFFDDIVCSYYAISTGAVFFTIFQGGLRSERKRREKISGNCNSISKEIYLCVYGWFHFLDQTLKKRTLVVKVSYSKVKSFFAHSDAQIRSWKVVPSHDLLITSICVQVSTISPYR